MTEPSKTPRTDAFGSQMVGPGEPELVDQWAEFARGLERELTDRYVDIDRLAHIGADQSAEIRRLEGAISDDMPKWREALVKISILDYKLDPLAAYLAVDVACTALGIKPRDDSNWVKCDKCYRVARSRDLEGQRCSATLAHNDPGCDGTMQPPCGAVK